jgi:hypothetical protein
MPKDEKEDGSQQEDVYGDGAREDLGENDEITPEEQAFMEGYDSGEELEEKTENDTYEAAFDEEKLEEDADDDFEEDY